MDGVIVKDEAVIENLIYEIRGVQVTIFVNQYQCEDIEREML